MYKPWRICYLSTHAQDTKDPVATRGPQGARELGSSPQDPAAARRARQDRPRLGRRPVGARPAPGGGCLASDRQALAGPVRGRRSRRTGGPAAPGPSPNERHRGGRGGGGAPDAGGGSPERDALEHAADGRGGRAPPRPGGADLAGARAEAPPRADLQALDRSGVRGEAPGRGGAVRGPAGAGGRVRLRREEPDPGAGPHAAGAFP